MSFPRGARSVVAEVMSWVAAAVLLGMAVSYFEEIKAFASSAARFPAQLADTQSGPHAVLEPARADGAGDPGRFASRLGVRVELQAGANGHFYTDVLINGQRLPVLIDTGASFVALPYQAAKAIGITVGEHDFTERVQTANGTARIAPVIVPAIEAGGIVVENVRAAVGEPGAMHMTLLGMSFLSRLQRAEIRRGRLVLEN